MNIKISLIVVLLFFLNLITLHGQTYNGTVADQMTQRPLPFVNIVATKSNYGTVSNGDGHFMIRTNRLSGNDSLIFSSLGYAVKSVSVRDFKGQTIYLEPMAIHLGEVLLTDRQLTVEEILAKVVENAPENYHSGYRKETVFIRESTQFIVDKIDFHFKKINFLNKKEKTQFNKEIASYLSKLSLATPIFDESLLEFYRTPQHNFKVKPLLLTRMADSANQYNPETIVQDLSLFLTEKIDDGQSYKVRSGWLPIDKSFQFEPKSFEQKDSVYAAALRGMNAWLLNKYSHLDRKIPFDFVTNPQIYNYDLEEKTVLNGESVYVISFAPQKKQARFKGRIFISANSFAIVGANYDLDKPEKSLGVLKIALGIQDQTESTARNLSYQADKNGIYHLKYLRTSDLEKAYINRPITFIENGKTANRRKLKASLLFKIGEKIERQFLITHAEESSAEEYETLKSQNKYPIYHLEKYDADIWNFSDIIPPEKDIKEFEIQKSIPDF